MTANIRFWIPLLVLPLLAAAFYYKGREGAGPGAAGPGAWSQASVPPPVMTPEEESNWEAMVEDLRLEAMRHRGRVAIFVKDLKTGKTWGHHPDDLFPSASLIKLPVMAGVFQKIKSGELSLDTSLTLRRRHRMGGSGSLKWYPDRSRILVRDVLFRMVTESDNTAMRMLIDEVGMGYLQKEFSGMGLTYTNIHPEGLSLVSRRVSRENYTTAREMAMLLEKTYRGELVDPFSSEMMLDLMKRLKTHQRLAKWLPPGWELAHKTGLLRGACHDVAVVFGPERNFILCVLTAQNGSYKSAKSFIARVADKAYKHYGGDHMMAKAHGRTRRDGF